MLKSKIQFIGKMLFIGWVIIIALYVKAGLFQSHDIETTLIVMVPVAGSAILALIVSIISDKRRGKTNEENIEF